MDTADQPAEYPADETIAVADGLSRQELFGNIRRTDERRDPQRANDSQEILNLYGPFRFPNDAEYDVVLHKPRDDVLFGADISHHTSRAFPIDELKSRKLHFLYMKASQATHFVDPSFSRFWARAGQLAAGSKVHRGAYHFLVSGDASVPPADWGSAQALAFVKVLRANGGLLDTDMPPAIDLEWDMNRDGASDRWQSRSPDDIIKVAVACLSTLEAEINRTPVLYTSEAWWNGRIGSNAGLGALSRFPLWLADYSRKSRASEVPRTIGEAPWALWQFTDHAVMASGFEAGFDASIFKGKRADFYARLGVAEFG